MHIYRASRRPSPRRRLVAWGAVLVFAAVLGAGAWLVFGGGRDAGAGGTAGGAAQPAPAVAAAGASPSPSVRSSPKPTSSPTPSVIEVGWVGDTTPGSRYGVPPDGGRALFSHLRAQLRAPDLMIANLEGTYSTGGPSKSDGASSGTSFSFQAPPSYAQALAWAGIDLVNLANNHSFDYFARGLAQTTGALTKAGVAFTGRAGQVTVLRVRGVRVAVVGMSPYSGTASVNDLSGARQLVQRAAKQADLVIVLMHIGAEGSDKTHTPRGPESAFGELRGNPRAFAHAVIDAGADLVLGSGPHVIRGIERYKGRLIAYSLGDFAGWGNFGLGGTLSLSGLLTVKIDSTGRLLGGRWLSLRLAAPGVPGIDPANASARLVRQLSAADFSQSYALTANGSFSGKP